MSSERQRRITALHFDPAAGRRETVDSCNLCASTRLVEVSRTDRYGYAQPLAVCADCGLGFLRPRPTADEYAAFYRETYRPLVSAYHGRLIDHETVQEEQRAYAAELVAWLQHALPVSPATVLDVGGSTGIVAGAFVDAFGARATVLDPAPDELAVARAAGMDVFEGFAEDYEPEAGRFDLILLCQTVDHLLDVRATLDALRRAVAPDGYLMLDVLDARFMLERRETIEGVAKVDHPFYLTRETAQAYLDVSGFAVVAERMSGDGHWAFLARPVDPVALDRPRLRRHADALLEAIWTRRAIA